jgi:hypothetical protein
MTKDKASLTSKTKDAGNRAFSIVEDAGPEAIVAAADHYIRDRMARMAL